MEMDNNQQVRISSYNFSSTLRSLFLCSFLIKLKIVLQNDFDEEDIEEAALREDIAELRDEIARQRQVITHLIE